ncbi:MAG: YfhO family protein [Chloroflexota bacterium]|nr:YfhO family protein [Dehalococcoidia bacterium]MDW8254717.1 YfhO family protein [Chloroflexota bacterium]
MAKRSRALAPAVFLLAVVLAWGGEILLGAVPTWGATALQSQPWQHAVVAAYRAGRLPLWASESGLGAPLAANPQAAAFSPFIVLSILVGAERGLALSLLAHAALAAFGAFFAARRLDLPPWPAALAGVVFPLSGALAARAVFPPFFATAAWLGLAVAAWPRAPRHPRAALRPAIVLALAWLDGHPQAWLIVALASLISGAWFGMREAPERRTTLGLPLTLAAAIGLGLALAAAQAVPAAELLMRSVRAEGLAEPLVAPYDPPPWAALLLIAPDLLGTPAAGDYRGPVGFWEWCWTIGLLALPVAALGRRGLPWLLVAVGVALAFLPGLPGVGPAGRLLAGGDLLRGAGRFLILADFGLALAAAAGLARAATLPSAARRRAALVTGAVGLGLAAGGLAGLGIGGAPFLRSGLLIVGAAGMVALSGRRGGLGLVLGAVAVELVLFARPLLPLGPAGWPPPPPGGPLLTPEPVFLDRFFAAFSLSSYQRPFPFPEAAAALPNRGLMVGRRDLLAYDPLRLASTERALAAAGDDPRALARLGVAEVAGGGVLTGTRPLVSWAARAVVVTEEAAALRRLTDPALDDDTVILIGRPPIPPPEGPPTAERAVRVVERAPGWYRIETASPEPGFLRILESAYPGWTAQVDGRPAPLITVDGVLVGVPLSAGQHVVELAYRPASFAVGAALSAAAWLVVALTLLRRRSPPRGNGRSL